jgi:hypothetical protein
VYASAPPERDTVSFPSVNDDTVEKSDAVIDSLCVDPVYAVVGEEIVVKDSSVRVSKGSTR